jgi:hypothetical protein
MLDVACYTLHPRAFGDLGRTVIVYDDILGVLVAQPVAFCPVGEGDCLWLETALLHDCCIGV